MRSQRLSAARNIAKALRPSEDTLDASILRHAQLVISIIEGRLQTGVAAEVGHDAFMSATAGLAALRDARDHVITCHKQLTTVRHAQNLDPNQVGCTIDKLAAGETKRVVHLPHAANA